MSERRRVTKVLSNNDDLIDDLKKDDADVKKIKVKSSTRRMIDLT